MSHNAIDYFAALSRAPGQFICHEAITDIIVVGSGELYSSWFNVICDDNFVSQDDPVEEEATWIFVPETVNGSPLEPPHIAFRRRKSSGRQDHITQVNILLFIFKYMNLTFF